MNKPVLLQRCGLAFSAAAVAVLLLAALLIAGSAQSAGGRPRINGGGRMTNGAGLSANPLSEPVDSQARVEAAVRSNPVMFIENVGQFITSVCFRVWGGGHHSWPFDDALRGTGMETVSRSPPTSQLLARQAAGRERMHPPCG